MDIKDFAKQFGDVSYADANKMTVGEGVVTFHDPESMHNAYKDMNGRELRGKPMRLIYEFEEDDPNHNSRDEGRKSRSRSRDRSRSRSPARSDNEQSKIERKNGIYKISLI